MDMLIGPKLAEVTTSAVANLGDTYVDENGTEYVYVKASGAKTAFLGYVLPSTYILGTGIISTATDQPLWVVWPQIAMADGEYGWCAAKGNFTITVAANCAANVELFCTTTAGVLDDASSSVEIVPGIKILTTVGGSQTATPAFSPVRSVVTVTV